MGRPRTATSILEAKGAFKHDPQRKRHTANETAKALPKCPAAPRTLSALAKKEWKQLAPVAFELGTLTNSDLRAFELLCEVLATETEARKVIQKDGIMISTGTGSHKSHPAVKIMEAARNQAARSLDSFGLTPKGRLHVEIKPPKKPNPFDKVGR